MKRIKKDLPIYVLSVSLVIFGVNTASKAEAHSTDTSRIRTLEGQIRTLQGQLNSLQTCINRQLTNISFYDPARERNIFVTRC